MTFAKIHYRDLNARQQETYNFQQVSAVLAEYGFATIKLNDDWEGADFIAQHIDGRTYLKVQLKGRLTFAEKYCGKDLYICFPHAGQWYLFPHDAVLEQFLEVYADGMARSVSWAERGMYSWGAPGSEILNLLASHRL